MIDFADVFLLLNRNLVMFWPTFLQSVPIFVKIDFSKWGGVRGRVHMCLICLKLLILLPQVPEHYDCLFAPACLAWNEHSDFAPE